MLGFESLLLQADFIDQVGGLFIAASTLISTAMGIIVYAINKKAQVNKGELTERDKQIKEIAKSVLVGLQKSVENVGVGKEIAKTLYVNVPEADRKKLEAATKPIIDRETQRLQTADAQAQVVKAQLIKLLGEEVDPDKDSTLPHESTKISEDLRNPLI